MRSGISFEVDLFQAPTPAKSARGRPPAKNGKADDVDDEEEDEEDDGDDDDGSDFDPGSEEETKKKKVNFLTKTLFMDGRGHKMIRIALLQASPPAKRGRGRPPANGKAKPVIADGDDDEDVSDEDSDDGGRKPKDAFGAKPPKSENKVDTFS